MTVEIRYVEITGRIHGNAGRAIEARRRERIAVGTARTARPTRHPIHCAGCERDLAHDVAAILRHVQDRARHVEGEVDGFVERRRRARAIRGAGRPAAGDRADRHRTDPEVHLADAVIIVVGDVQDVVHAIKHQADRLVELHAAGRVAEAGARPHHRLHASRRGDTADAVVAGVREIEIAVGREGEAARAVDLGRGGRRGVNIAGARSADNGSDVQINTPRESAAALGGAERRDRIVQIERAAGDSAVAEGGQRGVTRGRECPHRRITGARGVDRVAAVSIGRFLGEAGQGDGE